MALTFIDSTKLSGRDYFSDSGRDYEDLSSLSILSSRMGMSENGLNGPHFKRVVRRSSSQSLDIDPLLSGNLDSYPHLKELLQSYKAEWVKDDNKYGRYDAVLPPVFESQVFESPDTDVETELRLATRGRYVDEEEVSTSGRLSSESDPDAVYAKKHYGGPPLPCYYPVFNWHAERSAIFGQRTPELPPSLSTSGLKISVKLVSLAMQAGLVEPVYGTMCLYNKEKREKLSEDFHFRFLPSEFLDDNCGGQRSVLFSLEAGSPAICLLIQFEKHVTEEGGVSPSVYTRKEPAYLSEREKQKLQVWARVMPFREPFAWATVSLFDSSVTGGVGGFTSPSSPLPSSLLGSGLMEAAVDIDGQLIASADSKHHESRHHEPVLVDVPGLNRVKENYMEETLLDPKRLTHKPVKATLRLEVERVSQEDVERGSLSECGSFSNSSIDGEGRESSLPRHLRHASSGYSRGALSGRLKLSSMDKRRLAHSVSANSFDFPRPQFKAIEFRTSNRGEPMSQVLHCLYIYPQTINLSKKRNLFVRVELRKDDYDIRQPPLEALYPRDSDSNMQKYGHSQVDVNVKIPHFHDEFKIRLPAVITPQHHVLFTFFHVDLQMKLEAPKPVVVGYSVLSLFIGVQVHRLDGTLPVVKELLPHYLDESVKEKMELLDEGKAVFRLRSRLCSSLYPVNAKIREFFAEYDRYILHTSHPLGNELLEAIGGLKLVDPSDMLQFLLPTLNMLLRMIGDGGETLQVAAFRAMVTIITRLRQESPDGGGDRNKYLVQYVDYFFDDFGGVLEPVYPGLCSVWRSLARSKAKGYRVGPVYDDVLSMSWFFLELIVKSMALEQARKFSENLPPGEDLPPLQLNDEVLKSVGQLYDCLLTEIHDCCKKGLPLVKRLNNSIAFFCYDLLSVIEPRQVFELVALYFDKFSGICQSMVHECKLNYLRIISDHDLFVEMPGREPSERNYLAAVLMQELFITFELEDASLKLKAARTLVVLMAKHEYDARYQTLDDKMYIAQRYFPLILHILEEMPVFYNLNSPEKREILVCMLQYLHHLDDTTLIKAWQQSAAQTRLFFKLLEDSQNLFEYKKAGADGLMGAMSKSDQGDGVIRYTEKLSPSVNLFLAEASRHDGRVCVAYTLSKVWSNTPATSDNGSYFWKRVSPQMSSPTQVYREISTHGLGLGPTSGKSSAQLRASLHPMLRHKLEMWEENLSASVTLQILEIVEKFMDAAAVHVAVTDYVKLDCITTIFIGFLSRSQPLPFWKAFLPVFNSLFKSHGSILMTRENDRFLKQVVFHLLRLAVFRNESIRKMAVVGLQILVRTSFCCFQNISRLRVMLTITLSELMSDVQVTQTRMDGVLERSGEAQRLQNSLKQMAMASYSEELLRECGLPEDTLDANFDNEGKEFWNWSEVSDLSETLLKALDAATDHALMAPSMMTDKYSTTEGFYCLAWAYKNVPDLHIMWLLYLCDAHQQNQSWAEAAQCAVAVAGVIMQAIVGQKDNLWGKDHVAALCKICPMLRGSVVGEAASAEVEGYGTSKLTVESAVKYLQLANKLFIQAELFHFCCNILELIIPVYKARRSYGQLSKCYTSLCSIYEALQEQEASPIPFKDATYYRVGFYGSQFGKMDRKEYVYREARDVRLGDVMQAMGTIYESKVVEGGQTLHIIPDSRQVSDQDLKPGVCYLQITSVDPVLEDEDLDLRKERKPPESTSRVTTRVFDRFLFDTPFTKNGRTQGGLEAQWKRRTILQTEGPFPALVNRLLVIQSESREFSPIENAIGMIEGRYKALLGELEEHERMDGDQAPRLQSLQRILQGSVAVQVNSGVLGVCTAFLSGEPTTKLRLEELHQLISVLMEFMAVCKKAIRVHSRLIGEEDQDFHSNLVIGFQSLREELSRYIPAILPEL
nr:guanine nucleotide exchange factor SPIKE 1-like isoform X2 [Physcomitrium patens]|eukprot:XP_024395928.1 guanine nucleotide exchange factor SPIKE 1-like isoform X2 [Physcomitrella patens]